MGSVAMVVAGGLHVSLPGGVSGLLPESAMIGVADKYRVGDEICVEVARINLYDRQIELSLGTRT
ncbi:S1 RNA-binding domain-containing protein [Streptomyces sp. NPDC085942]